MIATGVRNAGSIIRAETASFFYCLEASCNNSILHFDRFHMHQFRNDLVLFLGGPYFWEWLWITLGAIALACLYRRTFKEQLQTATPPRAAVLITVAIFFAIVSVRATPTGDEPHYLVMSQSLLGEGDFDLRNKNALWQTTEPRVLPPS